MKIFIIIDNVQLYNWWYDRTLPPKVIINRNGWMLALLDKIGFNGDFDGNMDDYVDNDDGDDDNDDGKCEWANAELKMEYGDKNKLDELYDVAWVSRNASAITSLSCSNSILLLNMPYESSLNVNPTNSVNGLIVQLVMKGAVRWE